MQTVQLFVLWQTNISNWERSSLFWEKIHFSKLFFSYFFSKLILFFCFRSQLWQNTCGEQHRYLECVCVCVCVCECVCVWEREREKKERGLPIVLVIEGAHNEDKIKQSFHKYTFEIWKNFLRIQLWINVRPKNFPLNLFSF